MRYHILCTDGFSKAGLNELSTCESLATTYIEKLTHEELLAKIPEYHGLIVRSASKVSRDVIEAGKNLRIVVRAGVGLDNIDQVAAAERGIAVANAPAGNAVSTGELAFALMLALARHIPQASAAMHEGRWEKTKFKGTEIAGKTLGIVGLGRIGKVVASRARAFRMRIVGYDPSVPDQTYEELGVEKMPLDAIFKEADFLTVHTPLTDETTNLIAAKEFALMKPTACLVNCARGGIINEEDLAAALKEHKIGGAALDVFTTEPYTKDIFRGLDNVILTPHLGASTKEAQNAVAVEAALHVIEFFSEQRIQ